MAPPTVPPAFRHMARQVARRTGFRLGQCMYAATAYGRQHRNAIYRGTFRGQPAILKMYSESRFTDEPQALAAFTRHNRSRLLRAPTLFAAETISSTRGWLIMERLQRGRFLHSPLPRAERLEFLNIFVEYRRTFPKLRHRPLTLPEQLPAHEYHAHRLSQWFTLAEETEYTRPAPERTLSGASLVPLYDQSLSLIRQEFRRRPMRWCHGHMKPKEVYRLPDGSYVLTDFAHTRMYPEGYELAFIIWADWMLPGDWRLPYSQWKQPIGEWLQLIRPIAVQLGYKRVDALLRASLVERTLGTILADVETLDLSFIERRGRLKHLFRFLRELLNGYRV